MTLPRGKFTAVARRSVAVLFVLAGTFKLLAFALQVFAPQLKAPSFTALLQVLGVPFPLFFALAVPLLEVVGGVALWRRRAVRIFAFLLAGDMMVAIITVGWPARLGRAPRLNGESFGGEAWRLPLEIGLLIACVVLALRREK